MKSKNIASKVVRICLYVVGLLSYFDNVSGAINSLAIHAYPSQMYVHDKKISSVQSFFNASQSHFETCNDEQYFTNDIDDCQQDFHTLLSCTQNRSLLLQRWQLYEDDQFWVALKQLSDYPQIINDLYNNRNDYDVARHLSQETYDRICQEYYDHIRQQQKQLDAQRAYQQTQEMLQFAHDNYDKMHDQLMEQVHEWQELHDMYQHYECNGSARLQQRITTIDNMILVGTQYNTQTHYINDDVVQALYRANIDPASYTTCYGNQFQQLIHQECIDLVSQTIEVPTTSPIYAYKESLIDCIDSARAYNQYGYTTKATTIADFCWTLLDYGHAILEGAVQGVVYAVHDMAQHPIQTLACAVAGEYVLAYHLAKVAYHVADIGITALHDKELAQEKLQDYIAPIIQLCDAVKKKEISMHDAIRTGTALAFSWKTQGKLLRGLNKFYGVTKTKALAFAKNNPAFVPEQYMATNQGSFLQLSNQAINQKHRNDIFNSEVITIPQTPSNDLWSATERAIQWACRRNKLNHIYAKEEHGFKALVEQLGGEEETTRAILQELIKNNKIPSVGKFSDTPINVNGYIIHVRGFVHEGIIKIGTMFIPKIKTP